jgi:pyruvate/2-oxoglutarate dehydrogenase complex dihydrolipoamide dehydrogenase (E3) component
MKKYDYDIIIIGAGSGGLNVAGFFSRIGLKIALVDKSGEAIGGDCLNAGCVPSKALIHCASVMRSAADAQHLGSVSVGDASMAKVSEYIQNIQSKIRLSENPEYLKNKGIDFIPGKAFFTSSHKLTVGKQSFSARYFVIATGSHPRTLGTPHDDSLPFYTNETVFSLTEIPKRFVFIGGGPISCELGQAFSRLGAKVSLIVRDQTLLSKESSSAQEIITKKFLEEGIDVYTNAVLEKIENRKIYFTTGDERVQ